MNSWIFSPKPDFYYLRDGKHSNYIPMVRARSDLIIRQIFGFFSFDGLREVDWGGIPQITPMWLVKVGVISVFTTTNISDEFKIRMRLKFFFSPNNVHHGLGFLCSVKSIL